MSNQLKWDLRFLEMAKLVSTWSKDPSTQTGAVIVRGKNNIVSVGYNGFPGGMDDSPELYANREEKYRRIIHCEMNAERYAESDIQGCTLYTYPFMSCDRCFVHMKNYGIVRFVAPLPTADQLTRWGAAFEWVRIEAKKC